VLAQMGLHTIIVDERVVDVEQEDNIGRFGHRIQHFVSDVIGSAWSILPGLPMRWRTGPMS
jgi:hypothetical protein